MAGHQINDQRWLKTKTVLHEGVRLKIEFASVVAWKYHELWLNYRKESEQKEIRKTRPTHLFILRPCGALTESRSSARVHQNTNNVRDIEAETAYRQCQLTQFRICKRCIYRNNTCRTDSASPTMLCFGEGDFVNLWPYREAVHSC